jgi:hypothetical protein
VGDHQPPNAMNTILRQRQWLYPQCVACSRNQGAWLLRWWWRNR